MPRTAELHQRAGSTFYRSRECWSRAKRRVKARWLESNARVNQNVHEPQRRTWLKLRDSSRLSVNSDERWAFLILSVLIRTSRVKWSKFNMCFPWGFSNSTVAWCPLTPCAGSTPQSFTFTNRHTGEVLGCCSEGRGDLSVASVLLEPSTPLICGKRKYWSKETKLTSTRSKN